MTARPSLLSERPLRLDLADPRGDVLADVMSLGLLRNVLYRQIEARAPWGLAVSKRDRALLYVIARGRAYLEIEGEKPRILEQGHAAFLPRPVRHTLRDDPSSPAVEVCDGKHMMPSGATRRVGGRGEQTSIVAAFFELTPTTPTLLDRRPGVVVLSDHATAGDPVVKATIAVLLAELASPGPATTIIQQRLADVLVVQALRTLTKHSECSKHRPSSLGALSDPRIHRALSLMHAHVDHDWTVAELATKVGISRSGFAARFTELVGEPPLQYLARWRVARAAELLRTTDDAVGEIAAKVGYESAPSFNKAFKRWQGASPGEYRRASRGPLPTLEAV